MLGARVSLRAYATCGFSPEHLRQKVASPLHPRMKIPEVVRYNSDALLAVVETVNNVFGVLVIELKDPKNEPQSERLMGEPTAYLSLCGTSA